MCSVVREIPFGILDNLLELPLAAILSNALVLTITSLEKLGTSQTNWAALPSCELPSAPPLPFLPSKADRTSLAHDPQDPQ